MSLRQFCRALLTKTSTIMYTASFVFTSHSDTKKPSQDDKLKFEPPDVKTLTHEYMIQQSTIDAVNSATRILTVAYTAIIRTSNEYKGLLNELISLSRETLQYNVSDRHWDMIVELRSKVQSKKEILTKLTGYVDYVHKMAEAASEMSYLSGMDNLSLSLSQRIDDALSNIKEEVACVTILEQEYRDVQEQCIRHSSKTNTDESVDQLGSSFET